MRTPDGTHLIALTSITGLAGWAIIPWTSPGGVLRVYVPEGVARHEKLAIPPGEAPTVIIAWGPRAKAYTEKLESGTDGQVLRLRADSRCLREGIPIPMSEIDRSQQLAIAVFIDPVNPVTLSDLETVFVSRVPFDDHPRS